MGYGELTMAKIKTYKAWCENKHIEDYEGDDETSTDSSSDQREQTI